MYNNSCCHILSWILDPKKNLYEKRLIQSTCNSAFVIVPIHTKPKWERKRSNDEQRDQRINDNDQR